MPLPCPLCGTKRLFTGCLFLLLTTSAATSQILEEATYRVEGAGSLSQGDHTPYYLVSNRQGLSSLERNNAYLRACVTARGTLGKESPFSFETAMDVVAAHRFYDNLYFQQFYLDIDYRHWLRLSLGSKEYPSELKNERLSNGGLTFAGNARPIPQVRLEVPTYVAIPGLHNWLHIKGHIAYGRYNDDNWKEDFTSQSPYAIYQKDVLYHSKSGFLKVENLKKSPLTIEAGLEIYTQFGGSVYNHYKGKLYSMPHGFKDYVKAFIPMAGDKGTGESEESNIAGNQLGSWHLSAAYRLKEWKLRAYFEHFFEDHSQLFGFEILSNSEGHRRPIVYGWKDMLSGVELSFPRNRFISTLVYEYIYSKQQSGAGYHDPGSYYKEQMSGMDDYYNHSIYSAWQHYGMSIGSPVFISPIYNSNGYITFASTRLISHHVGLEGNPLPQLSYRMLFTHTRNWGTYYDPLVRVETTTNWLLGLTYTLPQGGWKIALEGALDHGRLTGNNAGGMLTVSKTGIIPIKRQEK